MFLPKKSHYLTQIIIIIH